MIVGRYYLLGAPGVALLGGWLTERFTRDQARFCVALLIGIFMLILPRVWVREEWREAVASVDNGVGNDCILLLNSGLIEGEHLEWLRDRKNAEYLTAPLRVYPSTCRVMVVPKIYDSSYSSFVETAVLPDIALYKKIYIFSLLSRSETNSHDLPMTIQSYNNFFADRKITYISEQRFGSVVVAQYQPIL